jgi:hypothetical protein
LLEASTQAARLQIVLRQRERALAALKRAEVDGGSVSPALAVYEAEIAKLETAASAIRVDLAAKDAAVSELRGRLDVEMNILRRESAKMRRALPFDAFVETETASNSRRDASKSGESLRDQDVSVLEDELSAALEKTNVAFDALGSTLGTAKQDGLGKGGVDGSSSEGLSVRLIDVRFSIPFETRLGQDLYIVGTWCDWDVRRGLRMRWTKGNVWKGTMPLHPGYNYEYKYVVLERRDGQRPGDPIGCNPEYGFAEPALMASPGGDGDAAAYVAVWQKGNNKALALDNISTAGLDHIAANDEWVPDPKNAPIQLVGFDGEVKEIVGSTKLLMECVNRADEYLEEVRAQMEQMYEIAAAAVKSRRANVDDDDEDDDDGLIIA